MSEKIYAERDIIGMDSKGGHYCRHISAMTSEGLHSKSDIAAELGLRDMVIADLEAKCAALAAENAALNKFIDDDCYVYGPHDVEPVDAEIEKPQAPATDAFLAEVRAQGAEECVRQLVISDDDDFTDAPNVCAMVAYQLRQEAAQ